MRNVILIFSSFAFLLAAGPEEKKKPAEAKKGRPEAEAVSTEVIWLNYEEGLRKGKEQNKNIFVDFYTNWCGWCKRLDKDVYADSAVRVILTKHFVTVKTNAESSRRFTLEDGREYTDAGIARDVFRVQGYPALWFLTPAGEQLTYVPGYVPKDKFINILNFIHSKAYQTKKFEEYEKELKKGN
jgi:thioredoxin-related protein